MYSLPSFVWSSSGTELCIVVLSTTLDGLSSLAQDNNLQNALFKLLGFLGDIKAPDSDLCGNPLS